MPKPNNCHVHFSTIIPFKKILKLINNSININDIIDKKVYIIINDNNIKLGYENEEINRSNGELYNKDKHFNLIINYINNLIKVNNKLNHFDIINILGDMFYCIIKYKLFYDKYYIPEIIN